jgi:hypothetical protein
MEAFKCVQEADEQWKGYVCEGLAVLGERVQALTELGLQLEDELLGARAHVQQQLAALVRRPPYRLLCTLSLAVPRFRWAREGVGARSDSAAHSCGCSGRSGATSSPVCDRCSVRVEARG